MPQPRIFTATRADEASVIGLITLAFGADPVARWLYADPCQYLAHGPAFMAAFGGTALDFGSAFCIEGNRGAALWLPPDVEPDHEALAVLTERTMQAGQREVLKELFERTARYHPAEPHWYLPLIGIDPCARNQGLGSMLMRHAHAVFDRTKAVAYLESSNERNIPFYQGHGYELLGIVQVGTCPPMAAMVRMPKTL